MRTDLLKDIGIVNLNNGQRCVTYAIEGAAGSGVCCLNGAAARLFQVDDLIIIMSYGQYQPEELKQFEPRVVFVDQHNKIISQNAQEKALTDISALYEELSH